MKRCPECEFLYYDEQDRCDIDGTRLQFTTKLPTLPAEAAQRKSMRVTLTFLVLATVILGIVLFILYPPQWHTSKSSPSAEVRPANSVNANAESQLTPSQPSQHPTSTPSPKPAAHSRDPFSPMENRTEKPDTPVPPIKP